jgi:hypothetical protein
MPKYKCHKEVWALKIKDLKGPIGGPYVAYPEESGFAPFELSLDYCRKHDPQAGGYFVVYKDGYESFSPADAFEEGYTRLYLRGTFV